VTRNQAVMRAEIEDDRKSPLHGTEPYHEIISDTPQQEIHFLCIMGCPVSTAHQKLPIENQCFVAHALTTRHDEIGPLPISL
jgi:hypothetical protein